MPKYLQTNSSAWFPYISLKSQLREFDKGSKHFFFGDHFMPKYLHTNSSAWSPYICLKSQLREFDKGSKHFFFGDHFINSHNILSWWCIDSVRRKLMLVTLGKILYQCFLGSTGFFLVFYHSSFKLLLLLSYFLTCLLFFQQLIPFDLQQTILKWIPKSKQICTLFTVTNILRVILSVYGCRCTLVV